MSTSRLAHLRGFLPMLWTMPKWNSGKSVMLTAAASRRLLGEFS